MQKRSISLAQFINKDKSKISQHPWDPPPANLPSLRQVKPLTTIDVRSSLSNRPIASSRDLYMATETRWVIRRLRSMDLPRSWGRRGRKASATKTSMDVYASPPQRLLLKDKTNNEHNLNTLALAGVFRWIEGQPESQRVASLFPVRAHA